MLGFKISPEELKRIREEYPVGCTVELIEMCDPYRDMPAGLRGTVTHMDDTVPYSQSGRTTHHWERCMERTGYEG